MNCRIFLVSFISLLTVDVSSQSLALKGDNIKTNVVEVLDEVLTVSTTLLREFNKVLDLNEKEPDVIKHNMLAIAVIVGTDDNHLIFKGIDKLRDGATDDGKAVINCLVSEQGKSKAVFTKFFGDIVTCAAGVIPKVSTKARTILKQLDDLKDKLQDETNILRSCSDSDLTCLVEFASIIAETVNIFYETVMIKDIFEIKVLIRTTAIDILDKCTGKTLQEFKSGFQDIFNESVVCIKK